MIAAVMLAIRVLQYIYGASRRGWSKNSAIHQYISLSSNSSNFTFQGIDFT